MNFKMNNLKTVLFEINVIFDIPCHFVVMVFVVVANSSGTAGDSNQLSMSNHQPNNLTECLFINKTPSQVLQNIFAIITVGANLTN